MERVKTPPLLFFICTSFTKIEKSLKIASIHCIRGGRRGSSSRSSLDLQLRRSMDHPWHVAICNNPHTRYARKIEKSARKIEEFYVYMNKFCKNKPDKNHIPDIW